MVDVYVKMIYDAVEYITDRKLRIAMIIKLTPISDMPSIGFRQQIIDRFFDVYSEMCAKN